MAEPPSHAVHLTAPQPHIPEAQSVWPPIVAFGAVATAVGFMLSPIVLLAGLLLIVVGIGGATREVRDAAARRAPPSPPPPDVWGKRPKQWWLAAGFAVSTTMVFVAILRAYDAHSLFVPENWPPPARELHGPVPLAATLALVGTAAAAIWGERRVRRDEHGGTALLALALLLGVGHLGWRAAEWLALLSEGLDPRDSAAAACFYAVTGAHALFLALGLIVLGMTTWGLGRRRLGPGREDILRGAVLYVAWMVVLGLVVYALVYLRLITYEGRTLL